MAWRSFGAWAGPPPKKGRPKASASDGGERHQSLREALRARGGAQNVVSSSSSAAAATDNEDNRSHREERFPQQLNLDWLNLQAFAPKALQLVVDRVRAADVHLASRSTEGPSKEASESGRGHASLASDRHSSPSSRAGLPHTATPPQPPRPGGLRSALQARGGVKSPAHPASANVPTADATGAASAEAPHLVATPLASVNEEDETDKQQQSPGPPQDVNKTDEVPGDLACDKGRDQVGDFRPRPRRKLELDGKEHEEEDSDTDDCDPAKDRDEADFQGKTKKSTSLPSSPANWSRICNDSPITNGGYKDCKKIEDDFANALLMGRPKIVENYSSANNNHLEALMVAPGLMRPKASQEPGKRKELNEFWGVKNAIGFAGPELGGTRLSRGEAQATLQRLIAAGGDFDEVRRLRKLISDLK